MKTSRLKPSRRIGGIAWQEKHEAATRGDAVPGPWKGQKNELELTIENKGKMKLGSINATFRKSDEPGPSEQMLEFSAKTPFDSIVNIKFLDNNGKEIETQAPGSRIYRVGDGTTYVSHPLSHVECKEHKSKGLLFFENRNG